MFLIVLGSALWSILRQRNRRHRLKDVFGQMATCKRLEAELAETRKVLVAKRIAAMKTVIEQVSNAKVDTETLIQSISSVQVFADTKSEKDSGMLCL